MMIESTVAFLVWPYVVSPDGLRNTIMDIFNFIKEEVSGQYVQCINPLTLYTQVLNVMYNTKLPSQLLKNSTVTHKHLLAYRSHHLLSNTSHHVLVVSHCHLLINAICHPLAIHSMTPSPDYLTTGEHISKFI